MAGSQTDKKVERKLHPSERNEKRASPIRFIANDLLEF